MKKEYYVFEIADNEKLYYLIWYLSDPDGFITNQNKPILFHHKEELQLYLKAQSINATFSEENKFDLGLLDPVANGDFEKFPINELQYYLNLFEDLFTSCSISKNNPLGSSDIKKLRN